MSESKYNGTTFGITPTWVRDAAKAVYASGGLPDGSRGDRVRVKPSAVMDVFAIHWENANRKTLEGWWGIPRLAEIAGVSRSTMKRARKVLVHIGALEVQPWATERGDRDTDTYRVLRTPRSMDGSTPGPWMHRRPGHAWTTIKKELDLDVLDRELTCASENAHGGVVTDPEQERQRVMIEGEQRRLLGFIRSLEAHFNYGHVSTGELRETFSDIANEAMDEMAALPDFDRWAAEYVAKHPGQRLRADFAWYNDGWSEDGTFNTRADPMTGERAVAA